MKHYYCLFSGGFDSTLAILKILSVNEVARITPIFFDYGQKARNKEAETVKKLIPEFRKFAENPDTKIDDCRIYMLNSTISKGLFSWSQSAILEDRPSYKDEDVENRNLILISCVVSMIMADRKISKSREHIEIITGFTGSYYDTSLRFIDALNSLFQRMRAKIKVIAPLIPEKQYKKVGLNKLIKLAHSLNVLSLLKDISWSCYYPEINKPCDKCAPCLKRKKIFTELGMKELKQKRRKLL